MTTKKLLKQLKSILLQEGFSVEKAYDGEQALEILKKKSIDLMIIDVMMPRTGWYTCNISGAENEQYSNYYPFSKDAGYG